MGEVLDFPPKKKRRAVYGSAARNGGPPPSTSLCDVPTEEITPAMVLQRYLALAQLDHILFLAIHVVRSDGQVEHVELGLVTPEEEESPEPA